ncbi:hypothetical protein PG987_011776 [Apiospora arundinis]
MENRVTINNHVHISRSGPGGGEAPSGQSTNPNGNNAENTRPEIASLQSELEVVQERLSRAFDRRVEVSLIDGHTNAAEQTSALETIDLEIQSIVEEQRDLREAINSMLENAPSNVSDDTVTGGGQVDTVSDTTSEDSDSDSDYVPDWNLLDSPGSPDYSDSDSGSDSSNSAPSDSTSSDSDEDSDGDTSEGPDDIKNNPNLKGLERRKRAREPSDIAEAGPSSGGTKRRRR